jgi:UDP-glucuronate 4-epimerase
MGQHPELQRLPMQPGDVLCTFSDNEKSRRVLGYDPQIAIEAGIPKFVEWFLANREKEKRS